MNALKEIRGVRAKQKQFRDKNTVFEKQANRILEKKMKTKMISTGTLGSVTWSFATEEDEPHKMTILPEGRNRGSEVNYIWGTTITIKEVAKLRDFLNKFLEWNGSKPAGGA